MLSKNHIKILITVPDLKRPGGVSALYKILDLEKFDNIDYFSVHGIETPSKLLRLVDLIVIYVKFFVKILHYDIVQVNPSFSKKSFYRDGFFIFLSKLLRRKVFVYWHGWDDKFENIVSSSKTKTLYFKRTFAKSDFHVALGNVFVEKLRDLGVSSGIEIESNAASDAYLKKDESISKDLSGKNPIKILFLARIEEAKGVFIAINTCFKLFKQYSVQLTIAGDGSAMSDVKEYLLNNNISNVKILGFVEGRAKHECLLESDILLFPTFHNEGMPISVIEGMLYGLPIITRPVGGIVDWLEDGKNGFLTNSLDASEYENLISTLLDNPEMYKYMSRNNLEKGNELFTPEAVTQRLFKYYETIFSR